MGLIKSKQENNYRRAITTLDGRFKRCKCCANRTLMDLSPTKRGWRCPVIGLETGRKFEVSGDHICEKVRVIR